MNDATTIPPSTPTDPERDDETPSPEFADALASFESGGAHAAAAVGAAVDIVPGAKLSCTIVSVGDENVLVDFSGRSEGAVETRHFRNEDGSVRVAAGDVLELYVLEAGDQVLLGPTMKVEAKDALRQVREAKAAGAPLTGRVTAINAGGLAVELGGGVRGFCPMSQIELGFCSEPSKYVGKTLEFLVTAVEEGKGSAVISRRQLLKRQEDVSAQQMIATLKPGDEREGTVARLEAFGAFVDIGGVDGMVHVSEIRHERTGHPNQVLAEGDKVLVRVMRIDSGKDGKPRIALSIKAATPDPWTGIEERITVGSRVRGTVVRLTDFGAFVNLAPGIDGLVHVSEISYERIAHPKDALKTGDEVEALVQAVDATKKRVSLSIKKTLDAPEGSLAEEHPRGGRARGERSERGPRESGPRQSGPRESGPRQSGPRQSGPRQSGPRESGPRASGSRREQGPRSSGPREPRAPQESRQYQSPAPAAPAEPTTMAIALRKAMEEARKREQGTS